MSRTSIGFKAVVMIFTFLVLIMLPRAAWSDDPGRPGKDFSQYPPAVSNRHPSDPNPEKPCVRKISSTDDKTIVAFHPWCDLRVLASMYPVYDADNKPLPVQVQLRGLYEANKDREVEGWKIRHTVMRGCVTPASPSKSADAEELSYCPNGLVNYFAAPSDDNEARIEVPRSKLLTYTERLEKLSKTTCATLSAIANPDKGTQGALESCHKMGIGTLAQAAPVVADEQPQSTPPQSVQTAAPVESVKPRQAAAPASPSSQELSAKDARIAELEKRLAQPKSRFSWPFLGMALFALTTCALGLALVRERRRNLAPIRSEYAQKLGEFIKAHDLNNEKLRLHCDQLQAKLDKANKAKDDLGAKLRELKSQPTRPPVGQMQRDIEKTRQDLAAEKAKSLQLEGELAAEKAKCVELEARHSYASAVKAPDYELETAMQRIGELELDLSAKSGEMQALAGRIDALKKSLDVMTGERNRLDSELAQAKAGSADLQKQLDELESERTTAHERASMAHISLQASNEKMDDLRERIRLESESRVADARIISDTKVQIERLVLDLKAKEFTSAELKKEISRLEDDLAKVGEANNKLVRQNQALQERIQAFGSTAMVTSEPSQGGSNSTVIALPEPPAGSSTVIDSSSTQQSNTTPEASGPQAICDSDISGIARIVGLSLQHAPKDICIQAADPAVDAQDTQRFPWAASDHDPVLTLVRGQEADDLIDYPADELPPIRSEQPTLSGVQEEQLTNPRLAVLPAVSKDLTDTIPPKPSTPPLVDFATMPVDVLRTYFRSSLREVGIRRMRGERDIEYTVEESGDVHCAYEILRVPIVWSQGFDVEIQRELGSPKTLLDCSNPQCGRLASSTHTKTESPQRNIG